MSEEIIAFAVSGIRRRELNDLVEEFIHRYGPALSVNLLKSEYDRNHSLAASGSVV